MSITAFETAAARPAWIAALARKDRAIVGPVADLLCIYGAPVIAFAFVCAFMFLPGAQTSVGFDATTTTLSFFIAAISYAHLAPVFVRSHLNPTIFSAHRWKLTLVPPLLFVGLLTSQWAFVVAGVVVVFWDVYHSAQQNFGLARIYDAKAGATTETGRMLDRMMCHAMYVGPIMAGASFAEHLRSLDRLEGVGLAAFTAFPQAVAGHAATIRAVVIAVMLLACVVYLVGQWRLARAGTPVSPHKVALMVSTTLVQILAWGFSPPAIAFMAVNLYHAVQYFGLVWRQEGSKTAAHMGVKRADLARPLAMALIFALPLVFGLTRVAYAPRWDALSAFYISVSLLHFWMDGFIWSVRKKTV